MKRGYLAFEQRHPTLGFLQRHPSWALFLLPEFGLVLWHHLAEEVHLLMTLREYIILHNI